MPLVCMPGEALSCYAGPEGTKGVGACKAGTKTCTPDGSGFGPCEGEVVPQDETCNTSTDDDCDGAVNEEGLGCACVPGSAMPCYSGPSGTNGVGACVGGTQTCNGEGTGYGPCEGEVVPQAETCNSAIDDDCDGAVNEDGAGCVCVPGSASACYSGPMGTAGKGPCTEGTQLCNDQGTGFGPCEGEVLPATETCETATDDDCDGQVNEDGASCVCVPYAQESCYSGPDGTAGVGLCKAGSRVCDALGTSWGSCEGEKLPTEETCATTADDDCDGQVNEDGAACICVPGTTAACYTGPQGSENVGICKAGFHTCNDFGTGYGECLGEFLPLAEQCNQQGQASLDENCNGQVNEACTVLDIDSGNYHTVALRANGTVWTWGRNYYGTLGDNTTTDKKVPLQVPSLSKIVAIAAATNHNLALKSDGTVWAWGYNSNGQLGDGTTMQRNVPVQVKLLTDVVAIATLYTHSMALKSDGTVWTWGYNFYGQLGNNSTTSSSTPVEVQGLTNVIQISAGGYHSVALRNDGQLFAWGRNSYGQLGDGATVQMNLPTAASATGGMALVSAGDSYTVGVRLDGTVWAWGYNWYGQLGNGTTSNSPTPVQALGLSDVISISTGDSHAVAIKSDGTVWSWGYNYYGQLGNGLTSNTSYPLQVGGVSNAYRASAGGYHSSVMMLDGTVKSFGQNTNGQLGNNTTTNSPTPVNSQLP
jgi:alpha-tubulin suppressor-like RCC1 family protein